MTRLLLTAALATSLLAGAAQAQNKPQQQKPAGKSASETAPGSETEAKVQEAVRREVARIKEELREEVRAEIQGAQAEAAFLGTEEKAKLQFLELHGYLRFRADLLNNLDLNRDPDPAGFFLFPRPINGTQTVGSGSAAVTTAQHGTLTSANMRFRLEPTLNVSEQVRIRSQLDMLDNLVLGSTPESSIFSPTHFGGGSPAATQVPPVQGVNADSSSIVVKRAWAEVQTPLGLLSFGRMPNQWALGILANPGSGLDDDFGDNVDRIQFAIPVPTPIGALTIIPHWDYIWSGVTAQSAVSVGTAGLGQPFDREQTDDVRGIGLKVLKLDSPDDMKHRFEKNLASFNYGLWYSYKAQTVDFPTYTGVSTLNPYTQANTGSVRRDAWAHVLDLWTRYETKRLRLEFEGTAVYGQIGNASNDTTGVSVIGPVLLRQFGGVVQGVAKLNEGRLQIGGELGMASGDDNPGFGNLPGRVGSGTNGAAGRGDIDGQQFAVGDPILDIRNFRFNRAYRIDLILWREILGSVTDAWYLKPTLRWEFIEGLVGTAQIVYSQAFYAQSTPSYINKALGLEADVGLSYTSDDGFVAWLNYGILFPLGGLEYQDPTGHTSLTNGQVIRTGLAVKF
jgi:uncharacterized protein (TIGR04551 family)